MTAHRALILRILVILSIYFGLIYFGGQWGLRILYPIRLFVTFLHELGHAIAVVLTSGRVSYIQIDPSGAGHTYFFNGNKALICMGGYLGSALFGNILFFIGARVPKLVKPLLALCILSLLFCGFVWYNSIFTTAILCVFAAFLFLIGFKTKFGRDVLMLFGLASVIYILQDTASGPSSDLAQFEAELPFLSAQFWMVVWLVIAIALLVINLKMLFREQ